MLLSHLFASADAPAPIPTVEAWREQWLAQVTAQDQPFELALRAGHQADRLSWAFLGGYQAALAAMLPNMPRTDIACLCATEASGNQPRHIHAHLTQDDAGQLRVSGIKRWSLAPVASWLWVLVRDDRTSAPSAASSTGPNGSAGTLSIGSNILKPMAHPIDLKLVRVLTNAGGVEVKPMPPTSFMPDLPHTELHLNAVVINEADVLPADGYSQYVKPFRTLEDIYVGAACLTHMLRTSVRCAWPQTLSEDMLGVLHGLQNLSQQATTDPSTHVGLAGVLRTLHNVYSAIDAHTAQIPNDPAAQAWQRDRKLFGATAKVTALRTRRAWEQLERQWGERRSVLTP